MKATRGLWILLILTLVSKAHALHYGLELGARSYVRGASARLNMAQDSLLWGQKSHEHEWKYGLYRMQAGVATHGQLDAALSVYPISFIEINYQKKWTQRYSAPSNFDCIGIQCYGPIERDVVQARMALAYEKLLSAFSYSRQWTKVRNTNESVYDELENILISQSSDTAEIKSAFFGTKLVSENNLVMGFVVRSFEYEASKIKNEVLGLALTRDLKWEEKTVKILGLLGVYRSNFSSEGLTVALSAQYTWGDAPLALF